MIEKGDIVARKSYGCDLYFVVKDVKPNLVTLQGINYRLIVDSLPSDLVKVETGKILEFKQVFNKEVDKKLNDILKERTIMREENHKLPGRVLHIDADENYLGMCLSYYNRLQIKANGLLMQEKDQPDRIRHALLKYLPDIVIITGHDSFKAPDNKMDIQSYRSSSYFVEAVKEARRFQPSKDSLIIFAGACQSYYEAIIEAGANFASSPERVLIHALDPVLIAEKVAYTPFTEVLSVNEVVKNTMTGLKGIGGIQTKGLLRDTSPFFDTTEDTEVPDNVIPLAN